MTTYKRQHYVPQFYLRNFAVNEIVRVFDKAQNKQYGSNIRDVCQEDFFYGYPKDGGYTKESRTEIETKLFDDLDRNCALAVNKLITEIEDSKEQTGTPIYSFTVEQMQFIALYVIFQDLRTREFRNKMEQLNFIGGSEIEKWLREAGLISDESLTEESIQPEQTALMHAQMLTDLNLLTDLLKHALDKDWLVAYNPTSIPFITSDHPLTKFSLNPNPLMRASPGWSAPFSEISIPLSPTIILTLASKELNMSPLVGKVFMLDEDVIHHFNHRQVRESTQHLFSKSGEFPRIEEIIAKEPESRNKDRVRVGLVGGPAKLPEWWKSRKKRF